MPIERDPQIEFHEQGTLRSVTRWISGHDEGIAELLKNARNAYQADRANVAEPHRVAVLLLKDHELFAEEPEGRIGLLDVGGATLADLVNWSVWQDPDASVGTSGVRLEDTQGNGGKAYLYRLFRGCARIFGVRSGKANCKGFEGSPASVERGTPGFVPDSSQGKERTIRSVDEELTTSLKPYGIKSADLPTEVLKAIHAREAFTLVEGVDPLDFSPVWGGRISAEDLIQKVLRHEQSTLPIEQMRVFAVHNGLVLNSGNPLRLEDIQPHVGFEAPLVYEIPEELPDGNNVMQSTTADGTKPKGRLTVRTSEENMPSAWKRLKPRWKVSYRTPYQMIGAKPISDLIVTVPGNGFVYASVELAAFEPDYVTLGRIRPNEGPLLEAVDAFIADKLRAVAKQISDQRRHEYNEETLDAVHEDNRKLDLWKNNFLPNMGEGDGGGREGQGGGGRRGRGHIAPEWGEIPAMIEFGIEERSFRVGGGVAIHLLPLMSPICRDSVGRPVGGVQFQWTSDNDKVVRFTDPSRDEMIAVSKGIASVRVRVDGSAIQSEPITFEVWKVDHVLLAPRQIEIPIGTRKRILAEVTNDEGARATNVLLSWSHDADDQLILRIKPSGWVTGNRIGSTKVSAGAGDRGMGGIWASIPADVHVVVNPVGPGPGEGFPKLLMTGRDIDPDTNETRPGDPYSPALWQEVGDETHNIWWLNVGSPEADFAMSQKNEMPEIWRLFHALKVVEMVTQVHMHQEYTSRGESERLELWSRHKQHSENFMIQYGHPMWDKLRRWVQTGEGLE
jgi:hypothetical protein